jgi:hypothetical protein
MTLRECPERYAKLRLHDILYGEVSILNGNKPSEKSSEGRELINTHLLHKYIPLDLWDGKWAFFDNDIKIDDKDTDKIKPLNEDFSSQLWDKFISTKNRHFMLLDNDEWPILLARTDSIYNWQNDWNQINIPNFQEVLIKHVNISMDSIILFFWMKERAIQTSWEIFLKYWINFLFDDECPILLSIETHKAIIFGPHGQTWFGNYPNTI